MKKQELIHVFSEIEPDEFMKQRMERKVLNMSKEKTKERKSFRRVAAFASCVAVIAGLGASLPVMAEYIPAVKNALEYFSSEDNYTKNPVLKNDAIAEIAETVNVINADTESQIALSIQNVYYDGNDIAVYYVIENNNPELAECTGLSSEFFEIYADGKKIVWSEEQFYDSVRLISAGKCDENTFAGMFSFKSDVLPDADNFNMELKINSIYGCNTNKMYFNYDAENPCYDYKPTDIIPVNLSCSFNVEKKENLIKTYEVNQEKNGFVLNSVTITPMKTIIDLTTPYDVTMTLTDDKGNQLEDVEGMNSFDTPLKEAEYLTLSLGDVNQDNFPEVCSFTVDIDGGYRSKDIVQTYKEKDRIYIPSQEEAEKWLAENPRKVIDISDVKNITPFNTYRDFDYTAYGETCENDMINYSLRIDSVQYVTNVNDIENLENCAYSPYELYSDIIDENGNIIDETLVILECTIRNNENKQRNFGLGIGGFVKKNDVTNEVGSGDYAYLDIADNGGKHKFFFSFAPYEERTIKVGRMVENDAVESGLVYCEYHGAAHYDYMALE